MNCSELLKFSGGEKRQIEWESSSNQHISEKSRVYIGETTVVEYGCSLKPKVFSHFIKEKHSRPNGNLVTLHYAHFKVSSRGALCFTGNVYPTSKQMTSPGI